MNKYLIYHPGGERVCAGESLAEIAYATGKITFSPELRKIYLNGQPDSMSWSDEFTSEELWREFGIRALVLLRRLGWLLYELKD